MASEAAALPFPRSTFDFDHCAMCKPIIAHSGLMEGITWDVHPFSQGAIMITRVDAEHLDAYRAAHAEMAKIGDRLMKGEQLPLCGSCTALGMCLMKGAKQDYIETADGDVMIITGSDPAVVTELGVWAKRNREEAAAAAKKS